MPTVKQLEQQLADMRELLQKAGFYTPPSGEPDPAERGDYIEFGSDRHAAFLGLIEIEDEAAADGRITYKSTKTERWFVLLDEVTPFLNYPDPAQVAKLTLRGKVASLESGPPQPPPNAPDMWVPRDIL